MQNVAKAATGIAVLGFLAAVGASYTGAVMGIGPDSFSNASTNLALIAICLFVGFKDDASA